MTAPLPAWHGYFDGDPEGFMFVIPGYALSGRTTLTYDTNVRRWNVTHTLGDKTWRGTGPDTVTAFLDFIAARCDVQPYAPPRRGDSVEAWLLGHCDRLAEIENSDEWNTASALLDDYRARADAGKGLTDE